ncbi:hypothetical protein RF679_03090 [Undibacterium cyanobacteriorum]|uniref:Uncharacterized protein n=1 Tax=Undibacterium cyanobacteriorum TaxID=3073561 RepID=A0ABY9RJ71_9BURK|nr:hypothetical protein [Undibacterium sp. 20NA77.5]WMW81277.1 hypothetical protein RF679_03090 [Undibacterium sp. 20NA77.5]
MNEFTLSKGTIVHFGTITSHLQRFFREGIPQYVSREGVEAAAGVPSEPQLYVGTLMAYFSACAAFGGRTSQVHEANQIVLSRFIELVKFQVGQKPEIPGLTSIAEEIGLPVVLQIELQEDCIVSADTHFEIGGDAEKSWKAWQSVILKRNGGIPSFWIKKCFFPRLLDFRDLGAGRHQRIVEQTSDAALMVGALMQSWHKDAPAELLGAYHQQHGRSHFSQSFPWALDAIEQFFILNSMKDPATRILNQMTLWQDVDLLAKKQGIPLQ